MFRKWGQKKYFFKALKITGIVILSIIGLLVLIALSIQIPAVQNKLTQEAVKFLHKKIGTPVSLDHISLSFPKAIVLDGLYIEDQSTDTLLYAGKLSVDTDLWSLTRNEIQLNNISLEHSSVSISRTVDGKFNFDYIIQAFAGDTTIVADTTSTPWTFTVGDIDLNDIQVAYLDSMSGNNLKLSLAELMIDVDKLDLDRSVLSIDKVALSDVRTEMIQWTAALKSPVPVTEKPDTAKAPAFNISVKEVEMHQIAADYRQLTTGQHMRLNLGDFLVNVDEMNFSTQTVKVNSVRLANTFLSFQQASQPQVEKNKISPSKAEESAAPPWILSVNELELENNNLQYYDFNAPRQTEGIDFSHLWITRFSANAEKISMEGDQIDATITSLTFVDQSGLSLTDLKGAFALSDTSVRINDFFLKTPGTQVALTATSTFPSLSNLGKDYPDAHIDLKLKKSTVAMNDILFFAPKLLDSLPINILPSSVISLDASAHGMIKDLLIDRLSVQILSSTSLLMSGHITGLPGSNPGMRLKLDKLYTTRNDVTSLLPDTLLPKNLNLPAWINVSGDLEGTMQSPKIAASMKSDLGNLRLAGKLSRTDGSVAKYNGLLNTYDLDVGSILGQNETMGKLTLNAAVAGSGLSIDELNTRVDLTVKSFEYQKYTYRDFKLNGNLKRYFFSGKASLTDKNLDFALAGDMDYTGDVAQYKFTFALKNADFKALHLTERTLKARATIDVKLATTDFTSINGNVDIRKVAIFNENALYVVDSMLFASIDQKGQSNISIRSDILSGDFDGTINLASIPDALSRHFNEYFSLHDTTYNKPIAPQKFSFNLVLKNTELLTELLLPDLEPFVPGRIEGEFDSERNILNLQFDVSQIKYGSIGLDSMSLNVSSDKNSLAYTLGFRKILIDTLRIEALRLTGKIANDSIRTRFLILDSLQKQKYMLGGAFYSQQDAFQFRLLHDQVILHYAPWDTPRDNYLRFTPKGILAHNFSITNINERISLITKQGKSPNTAVVFKDLNLQNLTNLIEGTILADGLINGDFVVSGKGEFNSALNIKKLKILDQEWGDVGLKVAQASTGDLSLDFGINGDNVELAAKGTVRSDSASTHIDFATDISRINMQIIDPFTAGQLKNSSGIATGEISVKGNATSPEIRGFLAFQDVTFIPTVTNSKFSLRDEKVAFTAEGIRLDNFRVLDERNNAATIKGSLLTKSYTTFDLDLALAAKNFQLLNSKAGDNDMFYGKLGINTNAKISGTLTHPKVAMDISLDDGTNVTYVVPQSEKGVLDQEGIVVWKDKDVKGDRFLASINANDTVSSRFTGLDLTANIEIEEKEILSVVIDPVTGDKLTVQGNSTLTLDIDPTGDVQLSGRYEITQGSYDLTFYKLVKRNFAIEKGSTITWSGDPLNAAMDIKASFTVDASPMELMSTQEENPNPDFKNKLPFLVYLNIDGRLLRPEISFALDLPMDKRNAGAGAIYAKLQDINTRESDLNKQVFALLILRRFVSDNLFASGGGDVSSTARRSVSKLLSEQLNKMSAGVKGVELSFDVNSYEDASSGEGQTEVQLGVSKSLLDDRLIVKVSGNVDIEGNASNQSSFADYIGDLALEYKLTPDGRFRITGFRNTNYDIISGELIETGAGLIYIKDYNTLRELFKANANKK
ncbi:MAG: translocation/assembly module TamB domain-containing protein [Chryseolinea sp.]